MTQEEKCELKDNVQSLLEKAEKELSQIELTADKSKRERQKKKQGFRIVILLLAVKAD